MTFLIILDSVLNNYIFILLFKIRLYPPVPLFPRSIASDF